jgi:Na+-translocating ferredoxin:NAD+ oxidoreductase subunit B
VGNNDQVYRDLRTHLDSSQGSFPSTKSGVEISLLKRFFTPEEARIALEISVFNPQSLDQIYKYITKAGMSFSKEVLRKKLDHMVQKGTLLSVYVGYKEKRYKNAGMTAGGIIDLQVNRMTREMIADFEAYHKERFGAVEAGADTGISMLRTVPVEKALPPPDKAKVADYDSVKKLIEKAPGPLAIANCPCRTTKDFSGVHCSKSDIREWCMQIGPDHARQYIETGVGREISKKEAFEILAKGQELGFVLDPGNTQDPKEICMCCGDCCGFLGAMKKAPRPADQFKSNYYAVVDPAVCIGCGYCIPHCQLDARKIVNGKAVIDVNRCIGCGNCVANCKQKASHLEKKEVQLIPVKTREDLSMKIMSKRKGKWAVLKVKAKTRLGMRV